jgi:hypothetical protein
MSNAPKLLYYKCPACHGSLQSAADTVGQVVSCPLCNFSFQVSSPKPPNIVLIITQWLLLLPVAFVSILIAQSIGVAIASVTWWVAIPLLLFCAIVFYLGGAAAVIIAPNKSIGATIVVTLFALIEGIAILTILYHGPIYVLEVLSRIYIDACIVIGSVFTAKEISLRKMLRIKD